ncbi:selenocysteine lyase/cysteine desulfurase [Sagittula marina]|uniref:Selenocysteine lyase/cysteine desulfurase n=1 Tax=Sagittula marina TaxID=943940 RepID=A0A7W6DNV8_9RHOB|nr:aminotransferase class V-fold PLP-dependent enzyme [Sagittula marina]MBB3986468.1 selenocysteine lyase/cysteine desulfurase [Sagittula marina]
MTIQFDTIRTAIIGEGTAIPGPFGPRALIYADYVASGRSISFIEDAIRKHVLPFYGNTHTETSFTGRRSTQLRELARDTVRKAVGADANHAVIFTGSGATGAADKLVRALSMQGLDATSVVFVGPYEHHSNDLIWRESGAQIVRIPLNDQGGVCLTTLESALKQHADAPVKIAAFSAASNVTGVRTDLRAIARLVHAEGGWCVADFAAAAPYIPVRLSASSDGANDRIDAAFLSPHKFPGGPGASGLLIADRRMLDSLRPTISGGGTVSYVTALRHNYVSDPERREEAGTPSIVENIRAGMVLQLKADMDEDEVERREQAMTNRLEAALRAIPGVEILGPQNVPRIGVFSFNIRVAGKLLHHNYVVALLNDLFGIQARGGCSCAGPYGHALLGIDEEMSECHERAVEQGHSAFRPGWARLGVNWFFDDSDTDRISAALALIAERGLDLLAYYRLDLTAGVWRAQRTVEDKAAASLSDLWTLQESAQDTPPTFEACLTYARDLADAAADLPPAPITDLLPEEEALRWFWMPHDMVPPAQPDLEPVH